jgi:acetyl-CoA C-acetyltransferase
MRPVAILGTGITKFGELWEQSLRQLIAEAAVRAVEHSKAPRIDALYVGCMTPGLFNGQEHLGALAADYLGMGPIPGTRVESACASGGVALLQAVLAVGSGVHDFVLAAGVEKMNDVSGGAATEALGTASDGDYELFFGATFPSLYALMATAHMARYGTTREMLSAVAVKNHFHGARNPNAQFPFELKPEAVTESPLVAEPLHLLDCSPITDGAAAVVVAPLDLAKKLVKKPVVVKGFGHATDTLALHHREDVTELRAVALAAGKAYDMAGLSPKDIHCAEVHDCFTIAEIMACEALGFAKPGEGGKIALKGETRLGGRIPVNTSGGLKAKGHPVGATGIAQIVELAAQLRGEAGERQVKGAKVGLAQNMGGTGASATVTILEVTK